MDPDLFHPIFLAYTTSDAISELSLPFEKERDDVAA